MRNFFLVLSCLSFSFLSYGEEANNLKNSFKNCLNQAVVYTGKEYAIDVTQVKVDGKDFSIPAIVCTDGAASSLYQSIKDIAPERTVTLSDNSVVSVRFMGEKNPPSSCYRVLKDKEGNETNNYRCLISFDLSQAIQTGISK